MIDSLYTDGHMDKMKNTNCVIWHKIQSISERTDLSWLARCYIAPTTLHNGDVVSVKCVDDWDSSDTGLECGH